MEDAKDYWIGRKKFINHPLNKIGDIFASQSALIAIASDQGYFANKSWRLALLPDNIAYYSWDLNHQDKRDDDEDESRRIGRDSLWPSFIRCVKSLNASPVVLTNWGMGINESDGALLCEASDIENVEVRIDQLRQKYDVDMALLFYLLYDQSAKWGLVGNAGDQISILGGEPGFMTNFFKSCGGKQLLRDVFEMMADEDNVDDLREIYSTVRASLATD